MIFQVFPAHAASLFQVFSDSCPFLFLQSMAFILCIFASSSSWPRALAYVYWIWRRSMWLQCLTVREMSDLICACKLWLSQILGLTVTLLSKGLLAFALSISVLCMTSSTLENSLFKSHIKYTVKLFVGNRFIKIFPISEDSNI